jgi:hypothetical protein
VAAATVLTQRATQRARDKRGEREGGPGLAGDSSGGIPTTSRLAAALASGALCSSRGGRHRVTDAQDPVGKGRERERGRHVGRPGKRNKVGRARMNSENFDLFKRISS